MDSAGASSGSGKDCSMFQTHRLARFLRFIVALGWFVCAILIFSSAAPSGMGGAPADPQEVERRTQHTPGPPADVTTNPTSTLTPKQKQALMKSNFEKTKDDASELADIANGLRDQLDKTNINVLSIEVIHKAEKIEKLARKIKEEAKGY